MHIRIPAVQVMPRAFMKLAVNSCVFHSRVAVLSDCESTFLLNYILGPQSCDLSLLAVAAGLPEFGR